MRLYIARHGETKENQEKRILGNTSGLLTRQGHEQARVLAANVTPLSIDVIFASDLQRVIDTCQELTQAKLISFTPQLRERNFGTWEGKLRKDVDWAGLWDSPDEPKLSMQIGAEPLEDFTRRIARFAVCLHEALGDTDKTVLLVAHIGVMNRFNFMSNPDTFVYTEYPNGEATPFDFTSIVRSSRNLS